VDPRDPIVILSSIGNVTGTVIAAIILGLLRPMLEKIVASILVAGPAWPGPSKTAVCSSDAALATRWR